MVSASGGRPQLGAPSIRHSQNIHIDLTFLAWWVGVGGSQLAYTEGWDEKTIQLAY